MEQTIIDGRGVLDVLRTAVDGARADRVFGDPIVENGVVVLPVAKVSGGGGGGGGTGPVEADSQPGGAGGGFGTSAKGLGVFVLKDGKIAWHPAIDVNRIVLGGQLVAITALLVLRGVLRTRAGATVRPARTGPRALCGSRMKRASRR